MHLMSSVSSRRGIFMHGPPSICYVFFAFFAFLFLSTSILFTGCGDTPERNNPVDPGAVNYIPPVNTLSYTLSVKSKAESPLSSVIVHDKTTGKTCLTDENGIAEFIFSPGTHILELTKDKYETHTLPRNFDLTPSERDETATMNGIPVVDSLFIRSVTVLQGINDDTYNMFLEASIYVSDPDQEADIYSVKAFHEDFFPNGIEIPREGNAYIFRKQSETTFFDETYLKPFRFEIQDRSEYVIEATARMKSMFTIDKLQELFIGQNETISRSNPVFEWNNISKDFLNYPINKYRIRVYDSANEYVALDTTLIFDDVMSIEGSSLLFEYNGSFPDIITYRWELSMYDPNNNLYTVTNLHTDQ